MANKVIKQNMIAFGTYELNDTSTTPAKVESDSGFGELNYQVVSKAGQRGLRILQEGDTIYYHMFCTNYTAYFLPRSTATGEYHYTHRYGLGSDAKKFSETERYSGACCLHPSILDWARNSDTTHAVLASARAKLLDKLSVDKFMLAKDARDAARQGVDYLLRVKRAWRSIKRNNWRKALREFEGSTKRGHRKAAADNWIGFQYGILPTIHAVQDAFRLVRMNPPCMRIMTSTRAELTSKEYSILTPSVKMSGNGNVLSFSDYSKAEDIKIEILCQCFRYIELGGQMPTIVRPVPVIWDSLKWSFILDWFMPISSWLDSCFALVGGTASDGCDSLLIRATQEAGPRPDSHSTYSDTTYKAFARATGVLVVRSVSHDLTSPYRFSDVLERSEFGLSAKRAINLFALLNQRR